MMQHIKVVSKGLSDDAVREIARVVDDLINGYFAWKMDYSDQKSAN